jgi:dipeptidyl aminopeptidase/acylaminoacyl peptidase
MKKYLLIVVGIVLLVTAVLLLQDRQPQTQNQNTQTPPTQEIPEEGGESYHPVSIPALANKEFDGRDLKVGQVLTQTATYTRYYITYKSGNLTISGIMNVPKGTGPFPVLFLNHGYIDTSVYTNGRGLRREQDYLANRGYAVIHSDYRNHASSDKDPDADVNFRLGYVEDVINAVMAVKNSELPYFDKEKIGMLGHSMGGGITQNILVAKPDLVDAAVLFAPVSGDNYDNFNRWTKSRPETAAKIIENYRTPEENPDFWHDISMINFLDRIKTPVMLHHGTADADVPIEWSDRMNEKLKEAEKNITYHVYPGQPHEFTTSWSQVMQRTLSFFEQNLK